MAKSDSFKASSELTTLDRPALQEELKKAERELFLLTMKNQAGELKEVHLIKQHRRYVARVKTHLTASV